MKKMILNKKARPFLITIVLLGLILGSAMTLAYYTDSTAALENSFEATEITTVIVEDSVNTNAISSGSVAKNPKVLNNGPATGFIRARVTVSPDILITSQNKPTGIENNKCVTLMIDRPDTDLSLGIDSTVLYSHDPGVNPKGWIYGGDGYYYYNYVVKVTESTQTLFDYVLIGDSVEQNFDITIYQEAVTSKHYVNSEYEGSPVNISVIKQAFSDVN